MGPKNLIIAIVLGIALAAGIFLATTLKQAEELQTAFAIPAPTELPEFSALDQSGNAVNTDTFRGHWNLVFFGFTHCPDICPATLQVLAGVKTALAESGLEIVPRIVLVSVDPERDTPEILGRYVNYFGPGNLAVTGELAEIRKLTTALGIYFEKNSTDDENYGVDHSAAVLVIDPNARFSALFSAPHSVENFVHDLPIIMGAN